MGLWGETLDQAGTEHYLCAREGRGGIGQNAALTCAADRLPVLRNEIMVRWTARLRCGWLAFRWEHWLTTLSHGLSASLMEKTCT